MCTYLKLISSLGNESRGLVEVKERKRKRIVLFKGHEVIGRSAFSNSSPPSFWHLSSMCIVSSKPLPSFSWLRSTVTLKNNQKVTNNLLTAYMTIISFPHFLCFIVKYGTHVNFKTKKSKTKTECCYEKQPIPPPPKTWTLTYPTMTQLKKQNVTGKFEVTWVHILPLVSLSLILRNSLYLEFGGNCCFAFLYNFISLGFIPKQCVFSLPAFEIETNGIML